MKKGSGCGHNHSSFGAHNQSDHSHENMNIRAAIIHIIGDII